MEHERKSLLKKYKVELWLVALGIVVVLITQLSEVIALQSVDGSTFQVSTAPFPQNFVALLGAPLDDVFIHCRFAQNLLRGNGFAFNPGELVSADTSPLWVILIAIGGLFTSHLELVAIVLSILFYLIIGPGVYRTARDVFHIEHRYAVLAGILMVLCSRLVWSATSGMEVSLATLLMLLTVEEHARSRQRGYLRLREGVFVGLGIVTRPEFLFVAALCVFDWGYAKLKTRSNIKEGIGALLAIILITLPYFLFNYYTNQSLLPHSSKVQGAQLSLLPNFTYLWFVLKVLLSNNVILFLLALVGIGALLKDTKWLVPILLVVGLPILQSVVAPQFRHHGRYFFPIFPMVILIGVGGWEWLSQQKNTFSSKRFWQVCAALLLIAGSVESCRWIMIQAQSVRNINDQHLAIADWVNHNTTSTDTLAVDDVGALAYSTNRKLIDLTGLITPSIFPLQKDQNKVWERARSMGANLFVIYDRLNPPFYEDHKDQLILIDSFRVRKPLVAAADTTMKLYRLKQDPSKQGGLE